MAQRAVVLTDDAALDLDEIWLWNAKAYGTVHADNYLSFLRSETERIAVEESVGRPVPARPDLRYLSLRKSSRGHGHVVIFRIREDRLEVLRFFHSAQDWPSQVARSSP